ncbi:MAG: WYL domain-containing protein [Chitinophagaceae bacterium]|jgi:predicted DNA-binding transcriptional regulator YafY|nr:WYL domain-containing protein [Chitinophagaceae bacterium]
MAVNKNAYQRYLIIDRAIRSSRYPASRQRILEKLAEELLSITDSMLSKDIEFMRTHKNAPIKYNRNKGGYEYTDTDYSFEQNNITEEDKWILDFAAASMKAYGNTNLVIHFDGLVNKLVTGSNKEKSNLKDAAAFINLESNKGFGYEYLHQLYHCIIEQTVVEIQYHPFGKTKRNYSLSPYLLKQYRNRWYVIGYAKEKQSTLVFALDRITILKETKHKYLIDTKFDKDQYFSYSFGATHRYDLQPEKVRLWFNKTNKDYILSQPLHHSQKIVEQTDNHAVVELEVLLTWELKAMIYSYSSGIKVLSPKNLQQEIADELKNAAMLYQQ